MDSLDGLRTYVSVVEAGSFTAAADRLGISKKLASKYIAELEARLGVQLLQRTTRTLSLTSAGQKYYPRCIALLEEFEAMSAEVRDVECGLSGLLRVSAPVSFGELFLQQSLSAFQDQNPDLTIDLRLNDRYIDLAAEGFDLAVRIGSLEDSTLVSRRLATTELLAVASPDYLRRAGSPETPAELSGHACIRDSNYRAGQTWPFEVNGKTQRIAVDGPFVINSASAVRRLALFGKGVAMCPDFAVSEDLGTGRLKRVLADFPSGHLGIQAVFTDARRMPARTRGVLDYLVEAFKTTPWLAKES